MALSVREQCRWFELELKTIEPQSKSESVINKSDEFYSSNGSLDGVLEKKMQQQIDCQWTIDRCLLKRIGRHYV